MQHGCTLTSTDQSPGTKVKLKGNEKTDMPSFSIATPCRNSLQVLKKCVGSIRNQKGIRCEHIIQDALSSDGTPEWLAGQKDLKWASEPDKGMYDAINKAWKKGGGDILSYLNADEQYLPGTLEYVAGLFESHPDIDVVFGDYIICNAENGELAAVRREIPMRSFYIKNGPLYALSCTLFFRRSLFDKGLLKLNTDLRSIADADAVLRLLKNSVKFLHARKYLSLFGITNNNLTLKNDVKDEIAGWRAEHRNKFQLVRLAARLMRIAEKAFHGCYARRQVHYDFCINETGETRKIRYARAPVTWKWNMPASG